MLLEEVIELALLRCMSCDAKTTAEAVVDAFFAHDWAVVDIDMMAVPHGYFERTYHNE